MINFIGHSSRSSGIIRGKQISDKLQNSRFVDVSDINQIKNLHNEVCLIVRQPEPIIANLLKKNKCIVGYDLLDRPVTDYHDNFKRGTLDGDINWERYASNDIDFYIVNNSLAKMKLSSSLTSCNKNKLIHVIPHHTVNFDNERIVIKEAITHIGYIGIYNQFTCSKELEQYCIKNNIKLVNANPTTRHECLKILRNLDVGLIFLDNKEKIPYTILYKPNTKLSNFQSFGIPTIAVPYESFKEFGGNAWLSATTTGDLISHLDNLSNSKNLREELSESGYAQAQQFHISAVIKSFYTDLQQY